jgi:hypothetical protein
VTWWLATICLWDALCKRGRLIMQQAKRLEDVAGDRETGDGLLGRSAYILDHIPMRRALGIDVDVARERITCRHTGSTIWAIPQGGSIIRQRTPSGIASDECAFQPEFEESFMAAMPCIRSGGWFVGATTADMTDGGFTRRVAYDEADA